MMSAMPAVAVRRERSKSKEKIQHPTTKRGRLAEYYHRKISRMGSIGPPARTYATAPTSPDTDLPPEMLVEMDPYDGRCSKLRRALGYVSTFHAGCILIVIGLVILFISMSTIKMDVTSMRGFGCFVLAIGAMLCFVRTVFFKKPENPRLYVLRLRSSESMGTRIGTDNKSTTTTTTTNTNTTTSGSLKLNISFGSGMGQQPMEMIPELPVSPAESTTDQNHGNGFRLNSPFSANGTERSPSPLRPTPTSVDEMLPGPLNDKSL